MHKLSLVVVGLLLSFAGFSQSIKSYVITSAGASMMNSEGALYISIGEPMNTEIQESDLMLSQGFLQVTLYETSVSTTELLQEPVLAFPNPTQDFLNIDLPEMDGEYQYLITDINGGVISRNQLTDRKNAVDLTQLNSGVYLMKVTKENKTSKTLKIIKQ